jgi:hypothetical protein
VCRHDRAAGAGQARKPNGDFGLRTGLRQFVCARSLVYVGRVCACMLTSDIAIGRNGGHELLRLRADFVARHAHAHRLVVAILEEHDPVLLFAALAADDAPAVPAVMPPLQQVEVFAARGARLCALVGLPFWPPVALRGRRYRALRPCMRALPPATFVGGATGRRRHGRWRSAWYGSGPRTAHLGISAADARYALASARQLSRRRPHVARAQLLLRLRQTARPFWVRLAAQTLQMAAGLHANMWAAPVLV